MKISAVICEYNPFHLGHAHHLAETRRNGADAVVCIQSGSFVQRGEAAIADKFARAEAAVRGGADLVVELPHAFAMASAPRFAAAGVHLAALCGADTLSFGAECADIALLSRAALLGTRENMQDAVKSGLSRGLDHPAALTAAMRTLDPAAAKVLESPNNVLAVEYLRALSSFPGISPLAVPRRGAGHDDAFGAETASASFLRALLSAGGTAEDFLPAQSAAILRRERARGAFPVTAQALDAPMLAALKRLQPEDFARLPDVGEGLVKTKRYTYARIRRIAAAAYTGLTRAHQAALPGYLRVLALNRTGRKVLAALPEGTPVVTKPALRDLKADDETLFALESRADALWALGCPNPAARAYNTLRKSQIYVNQEL